MPATHVDFRGTERLEIRGTLGQGGMGVVYRAFDTERGVEVALKTLRAADPDSLLLFKREFRSLADISHPNLVNLHELVSDGEHWLFTMELIAGNDILCHVWGREADPVRRPAVPPTVTVEVDPTVPVEPHSSRDPGVRDVGTRRAETAPLDLPRIRTTFAQLAEGIEALHRFGFLHRDIKPSNVLVEESGRVVLLDFGLVAEFRRDGPQSNMLMGTPAYMAPEQARGLSSAASDWYAFGTLLFEALTGQRPFQSDPATVLDLKRDLNAPRARALLPEIPPALDELCAALLSRNAGDRPGYERVLRGIGAVPVQSLPVSSDGLSSEDVFVGRDAELTELAGAAERTRRGLATLCFVHGTSGTGKSALVRHFAGHLRRDAVVLRGRCYERESVPYKAVDSSVDALVDLLVTGPAELRELGTSGDIATLARLFPAFRQLPGASTPLGPLQPSELRARGFAALRAVLTRLCEHRHVILSIDDLQWGDLDSALLLEAVLRPPAPPLMFIGCYRTDEADDSPFLSTLRTRWEGRADLREIELARLGPEDTVVLARGLLGTGVDQALVDQVAGESGGHPFFLQQLSRYVTRDCVEHSSEGALTLERVIQQRVQALPEDAQRLLETLSVAGRPIRQSIAGEAAEITGSELPQALQALHSERLVLGTGVRGGDIVEVYHDRIRETVADGLPVDARRRLHAELASAFERSPRPDIEAIATHLHAAGETTRAARHALAAGRAAEQVLAFDQAASLYRLALPAGQGSRWRMRRILTRLGDALAHAGRGPEAADAYLEGTRQARDSGTRVELRRRAAEQLLNSGHADRGIEVLRDVLQSVGATVPGTKTRAITSLLVNRGRARVGLWRARRNPAPPRDLSDDDETRIRVYWSVGRALTTVDPIRSADFNARHLQLALRSGRRSELARGLAMEAVQTATIGRPAQNRVRHLLELAQSHARSVGDTGINATLETARSMATYLMGHWRRGLGHSQTAIELCGARPDLAWERNTGAMFGVLCMTWMGNLARLGPWVSELIETAEARGDLQVLQNLSGPALPFVRLAKNKPQVALAELDAWEATLPKARYTVQNFNVDHSRLYVRRFVGADPEETWARCEALARDVKRSFMHRVQQIRLVLGAVQGVCAMGLAAASQGTRRAEMTTFLRRQSRRLQGERGTWGEPTAALLRAGRAALQGDDETAAHQLELAERGYEAHEMRMHWASARVGRARLLGGSEGDEISRDVEQRMSKLGFVDPLSSGDLLYPF